MAEKVPVKAGTTAKNENERRLFVTSRFDSLYLHPLPLPDVVYAKTSAFSAMAHSGTGRCFCCCASVNHLFELEDSLPLTRLSDEIRNMLERKEKAVEVLQRAQNKATQLTEKDQIKHQQFLRSAQTEMTNVSLAARQLLLRHIPKGEIDDSNELNQSEERELELQHLVAPFHLCAFCFAWHALNSFPAIQGVMVWLPDLHPRNIVAVNRQALKAIFSSDRAVSREGKQVLYSLLQHRGAVEEKFGTFRPADFADVLRRYPPSGRDALRVKMAGVALILTPDSFPSPDDIS